ncbi:MAG: hypothetical protein WAK29_04195 [Terriglobales bacterium]
MLGTLVGLAPVSLWPQAKEDEKAGTVLLADGTPIHLVLMDDLQGKELRIKQSVHFKVREDLVVGPKLIVKTGSEAIGHIESVSKSGLLGKSGRLVLQFDYVTAVSGAKLLLRGGAGVSGGKGGALTWESALWYGPNANLPVGTVLNAYVNQDQRVTIP